MKKLTLLILILLIVVPVTLQAGGKKRAGTAAAPELTIPLGARYLGSGGSALAVATGLESIYWNPAGVDRSPFDANALFSYRSYIADINVAFAGVSGKFDFGSIALSLRSFGIGDIPVTTESAPDGTGEIITPNFFVLGVTYSKILSERTSIGVTVNLINEAFGRVSSSGVSFDMGVQYQNLAGVQGLGVGVTVKNIGPAMRYDGPALYRQAEETQSARGITYYKVGAAEFDLPSVFEIGLSYRHALSDQHTLNFSSAYQNNNFALDEFRAGVEYSYQNLIQLRGGYMLQEAPIGVSNVETPQPFKNLVLGFGVNLAEAAGMNMVFDYAYVPGNLFSDNHLISINLGF